MSSTLAETTHMLHDAFDGLESRDDVLDTALATVSGLAQPSMLAGLVRSLRASAQAVDACATLSYHHPLGFDKLALIDAEPEFMLRLHVWWPGNARGAEHVHNHRFGLATCVVRGGYDMEVFQPAKTGLPMVEYREKLSPGSADWELDPLNPLNAAHLRLLTRIRLAEGAGYALAANTLHRVGVAPGALCVTLFLETLIVGSKTRVFAEPDQAPPAFTPKEALNSDGYLQRVDAVLDELAD